MAPPKAPRGDGPPDTPYDHPPLSVCAAVVAAMGVTYGMTFYAQFNVNIFDYANVADFVVFSLRNVAPIILATLAAAFFYFKRKPSTTQILAAGLVGIVASSVFGGIEGNAVRERSKRLITFGTCQIVLADELNAGETQRLTPIGSAGDFFIYFQQNTGQTRIVPRAEVSAIVCR